MKIFLFLLCIPVTACSNHNRHKKLKPKFLDKITLINRDSCQKWNLPTIDFKVEYPDNYQVIYNVRDNYLDLTKYSDSAIVDQEFSFGKCENIRTKEEIEKFTYKADSIFRGFKTYQTK